jgi:hypothetical protein
MKTFGEKTNFLYQKKSILIMLTNNFIKATLILSLIIVGSILASSITKNTINQKVEIVSFETDKKVYRSNEEMKIFVFLKSSKEFENVTVNVYGIIPRAYAYINESKTVNLKNGENRIVFQTKTPYCTSGCGGVNPGSYDLYVKVFIDGKEVTNSTTKINLVQG